MTQTLPKPPAGFRKHVFTMLGERYSDKTLVLCPTVFVRLLGGDHKAAIFLSQILYWSDRTKDKDGWFYKSYADWQLETGLSESQIRRIVNGDARVKAAQITLRDLGVETKLQKVKRTGAPTLHYRINQMQFLAALDAFITQTDPQQCEGSTPDSGQDEPSTLPGMNAEQCTASLIPPETSSPDQQAKDSDPQNPATPSDEDADLLLFTPFEIRFGKLKAPQHELLRTEQKRLGREGVGQVLERCATRGRSWSYVLKALANERAAEVVSLVVPDERYEGFLAFTDADVSNAPAKALLPVSERLQTPWSTSYQVDGTVALAWEIALGQLEAQLDRSSFNLALRDATLVDFDPANQTFVIVAYSSAARDRLQYSLQRLLLRVIATVYQQPAAFEFLLEAEWRVRQSEAEAAVA